VVELAIGEKVARLLSYDIVILLRPALLQTNNVWPGVRSGDLVANLLETLVAELRDELETPAIQREDPDVRRWLVGSH
jgi:hypothetical protein